LPIDQRSIASDSGKLLTMISSHLFLESLRAAGIDFFTGVPDSLLKDVCAKITDEVEESQHVIAANEGAALALASGWYLATSRPALVYLQNSGLGNLVNPLTSLTDPLVYSIPALLLIGWRGEPNVADEPQHVKQGAITPAVLDCLGIPYFIVPLDQQEADQVISMAVALMQQTSAPVALLVRKGTFEPYKLLNSSPNDYPLGREEAIACILKTIQPEDVVVSTTGMISREVYEYRTANGHPLGMDFLTVGCMGHSSQIALGIALARPNLRVVVIDGDGAMLMHLGSLAIIGSRKPNNFLHIVLNNGAHDSVGGQPTIGFAIDFCELAKNCGYAHATSVSQAADVNDALNMIYEEQPQLSFIEVRVKRGSRADLGRPKSTPSENKEAFMARINSL
jgi:phosphonopyruvate decarboxylase